MVECFNHTIRLITPNAKVAKFEIGFTNWLSCILTWMFELSYCSFLLIMNYQDPQMCNYSVFILCWSRFYWRFNNNIWLSQWLCNFCIGCFTLKARREPIQIKVFFHIIFTSDLWRSLIVISSCYGEISEQFSEKSTMWRLFALFY